MYPAPAPPLEDEGRYQAKLIVNMVVVVFLIVGILLVMQYFNFLYLKEVPMVGGWLMELYERVFGVPKVLILHGEDSIGDWTTLRDKLSRKLIFYSEDIDVTKFGSGMGDKLKNYGLVIVEDARRLDKDKLVNLRDYVIAGGNLIWVGDAGTQGYVEFEGRTIVNQTGWIREIVCIDQVTQNKCNCKDVGKDESTCRFLSREEAEWGVVDMTDVLGVEFHKNELGINPELEIVDKDHWATAGINTVVGLPNVNLVSRVSNAYSSALVANINMRDETYPGIIVNTPPGSWGGVVYFAYPPEETMEIVLPLVQRLRY